MPRLLFEFDAYPSMLTLLPGSHVWAESLSASGAFANERAEGAVFQITGISDAIAGKLLVVPEPTAISLILIGACGLCRDSWHRLRRRRETGCATLRGGRGPWPTHSEDQRENSAKLVKQSPGLALAQLEQR